MITVLLFAHLQEEIGESQLTIEALEMTVSQVKKWIEERYQVSSLHQVMAAVNENFAMDETIVKEGDTIAFIPPVSGG
ncbi:molybdopterin converting factor subunit 1 [Bacillus sp. FJAT-42315]|uniref:molybdopterin converting factor subunit 1 n=1 Tax=Bacillus sp. FJAT-42315 TaxID=2014077 RepID=UPI000C24DCD4|nr:molybdopterin converting factor subunit 1 [Bacillus sp. FJAT-42315]